MLATVKKVERERKQRLHVPEIRRYPQALEDRHANVQQLGAILHPHPASSQRGFPPPPEFLNFAGPAVVRFQPQATAGSPSLGRIVYTTFHNDEQADALMQNILNYLVFLL